MKKFYSAKNAFSNSDFSSERYLILTQRHSKLGNKKIGKLEKANINERKKNHFISPILERRDIIYFTSLNMNYSLTLIRISSIHSARPWYSFSNAAFLKTWTRRCQLYMHVKLLSIFASHFGLVDLSLRVSVFFHLYAMSSLLCEPMQEFLIS